MDALAGYGSDSSGSGEEAPSAAAAAGGGGAGGGGALSGLLGHYSDESDDGNERQATTQGGDVHENKPAGGEGATNDDGKESAGSADGEPTKKRRRRWDNQNDQNGDAHGTTVDIDSVLPPPPLLNATPDEGAARVNDPFQAMVLFRKEYTTDLRRKLSQQMQQQSKGGDVPKERQQLNHKLEQLHDKFHQREIGAGDSTSAPSSFAAHLKSQHEFGNPHLVKAITDHFDINPLESHVGNKFKPFEYVERLMSAEERARIAAANYDAGMGMGGGPVGGGPGPGA